MNFLAFIPKFTRKTAAHIMIVSILVLAGTIAGYLALDTYEQIEEMNPVVVANRCDAEMKIYATEEEYNVGADLCYKTTQIIRHNNNEQLRTRAYILGSFGASFLIAAICYALNAAAKKKGTQDVAKEGVSKKVAKK